MIWHAALRGGFFVLKGRLGGIWVPPPKGRLHPVVIEMLGRSEFVLRQGFACGKTLIRRKGADGQMAGWVLLKKNRKQPKRIWIVTPCQRERASYPEVLSLWAPAAEGGLRPSVIQMLGGSEFRLRRGFACGKAPVRRKCAAGQKAGGVGLLYLFEILKYRF